MTNELIIISKEKTGVPVTVEFTTQIYPLKISMGIDDFKSVLAERIGSITFTFTKSGFKKKLDAAIEQIILDMKKETVKVVK